MRRFCSDKRDQLIAANIRTTFRERPMGLISWAWTNLAPPGANCAADSTTLVWGAFELDLVAVIVSVPFLRKFAMKRLRVHDDQ